MEQWECQFLGKRRRPKTFTKLFPYAIFCDFESFVDKNRRKQPTKNLTYEAEHVLILVSVADTLNPKPTHICDRKPKELCCSFVEELERRAGAIRGQTNSVFLPKDL